jgi:hypothetical protein
MFALGATAPSADLIVCIKLTASKHMTPHVVERVISDARLLARRDSTPRHPCVDRSIEDERLALVEMYFQFQDGMRKFEDLVPFVVLLKKKVDANRMLLKWEQEHMLDN